MKVWGLPWLKPQYLCDSPGLGELGAVHGGIGTHPYPLRWQQAESPASSSAPVTWADSPLTLTFGSPQAS